MICEESSCTKAYSCKDKLPTRLHWPSHALEREDIETHIIAIIQ